jgi:hypothetical protein
VGIVLNKICTADKEQKILVKEVMLDKEQTINETTPNKTTGDVLKTFLIRR